MRKPRINEKALAKLSPQAQAEARKLLLALEDSYRANPLGHYFPHEKQDAFHRAHVSLRGFFGGNRSGKTTAGILDDIIQAVDRDCLPAPLLPYKRWEAPFYCRIIAPDFTFKNGSWFDFLTFEQDIDKFGGAALHRVHYDEEPPRDIRRESLMRLIDYGGDEIFTMTPLQGMSWMFDEIWLPWERGKLTDTFVQTVDMDDNPHLDQKTKERVLAGLSKEEREARKSGRFVHFGGMIYSEFDKLDHVIPFDLPKTREQRAQNPFRVYVGIDPGIRHMAAVVWVAHFPDDMMVAFSELALQDHTIGDVCKAIHLMNQGLEITPFAYYIDPAARNRNNQTGRSDQMEFIQHGIIAVPGQNSVTAGINAVKERLQHRDKKGNLTPTLVIAHSCPTLIDEFPKYRWKPAGRSQAEPKEEPVKADDHLLDALRYVCMSMPTAPTDFVAPLNESPIEKLLREDQEGVNFRKQRKNQSTEMGDIFQ